MMNDELGRRQYDSEPIAVGGDKETVPVPVFFPEYRARGEEEYRARGRRGLAFYAGEDDAFDEVALEGEEEEERGGHDDYRGGHL